MSWIRNRIQVYDNTTNRYYLFDTSKEEWKPLGDSYKRYKRVKMIFPSGAKIEDVLKAHSEFIYILKHLKPTKSYGYESRAYISELEPIGNLTKNEMGKLANELGLGSP